MTFSYGLVRSNMIGFVSIAEIIECCYTLDIFGNSIQVGVTRRLIYDNYCFTKRGYSAEFEVNSYEPLKVKQWNVYCGQYISLLEGAPQIYLLPSKWVQVVISTARYSELSVI